MNLIEKIRARPGMWVGDPRDGSALHHILFEVLDLAVAAHLRGEYEELRVILNDDRSVTVAMPGYFIPPEAHLATMHGERAASSPGLVGIIAVVALSSKARITSTRDMWLESMSFVDGLVDVEGSKRRESVSTTTSTEISFTPDPKIFRIAEFDIAKVERRLREIGFLNPKLHLSMHDRREHFTDHGGLTDFVRFMTRADEVAPMTPITGRVSTSLLRSSLFRGDELPPPAPHDTEPTRTGITVDFALTWRTAAWNKGVVRGFVNQYETHQGGPHTQGLVDGVLAIAPAKKGPPSFRAWLSIHLVGVIAITHPDPSFDSPTRSRLYEPRLRPLVCAAVEPVVLAFFAEHPEVRDELRRLALAP